MREATEAKAWARIPENRNVRRWNMVLNVEDARDGVASRRAKLRYFPWLSVRAIVLMGLCGLLCACGAKVKPFQELSQAGTAYGEAMNAFTSESAQITIEANSLKLASNRSKMIQLALEEAKAKTLKPDQLGPLSDKLNVQLNGSNAKLEKRIALLVKLNRQTALLAGYFKGLAKLAGDDVSEDIEASVNVIWNILGTTSLGIKDLLKGQDIQEGAKVIVGLIHAKLLEKELKEHAQILVFYMNIQEAALKHCISGAQLDFGIVRDEEMASMVTTPYVLAGKDLPKEWFENRSQLVRMYVDLELLEKAALAAKGLKQAFIDLSEGKYKDFDIAPVTAEIQALSNLVKILQATHAKSGGKG
jgi:hypothetical protein